MSGCTSLDCRAVRVLGKSLCFVHVSVIPRALFFALPCAGLAAYLKYLQKQHFEEGGDELPDDLGGVKPLFEGDAYGGFTFAMSFLFVFRTSQAFGSFCEGVAAGYAIMCHWTDFVSTIVACCKYSKKDAKTTLTFQNRLVRLCSFMNAACLASLRGVVGSSFEVIDIGALEEQIVEEAMTSEHPVLLIGQWINELVMEGMEEKIIAAPASFVNGALGKFSKGCERYNTASRVQRVGFPIHFTQLSAILLLIHWCVTPFAMCQWTNRIGWTFFLTLIQVTFFWVLYFTAVIIELPFKTQDDDGNRTARLLQEEFNQGILLLVDGDTQRIPGMKSHALLDAKLLSALHEQSRIPVGDVPDLMFYAGREQEHAIKEADAEVLEQITLKQREKQNGSNSAPGSPGQRMSNKKSPPNPTNGSIKGSVDASSPKDASKE